MPAVTLPDGQIRVVEMSTTVFEVVQSIGSGLAKAAVAADLNGSKVDLSFPVCEDCALTIYTGGTPEGVEVIRHSTAHLLAHAVKRLFPEAQVTIGPVIEDGFYYDFAYHRPFTPEDLEKIEICMKSIAAEDIAVTRSTLSREEAIEFFKNQGEFYKAELVEAIPAGQTISLYTQQDFVDLCRGPHVPSTGKLKAFKLMRLAGAYWRGDSRNAMLQRIYGTAWPDQKSLKEYLTRLEEAERRDHRRLGKVMDLFHFQEEAPGMVFWHDKGWQIYLELTDYIRKTIRRHGYQEVHTPEVVDRSLWERSGHWEKFHADMFTTQSENRDYAVKPMNCPCHIQIYNQGLKSYRDLPIRLAEFGSCHRNEPSGTLHGLMRLRNFVQDDAHIFCTEGQIQEEVGHFIDLLFKVYADLGFQDVLIRLSTRPANRVGDDSLWDKAEEALATSLVAKNLEYQLQPGEGAFYGPKIEFSLRDSLHRVWQCGTIQVDFSMPGRLGAYYIAEDGSKQTPVMLHRAVLGSTERFIGILTEHYAGDFPLWLSPVQAIVMTITERQAEYAQEILEKCRQRGLRAAIDLRNEKIGYKIREHTLARIPYLMVVGDKEVASSSLALRKRTGEDLGSLPWNEVMDRLVAEAAKPGDVVGVVLET